MIFTKSFRSLQNKTLAIDIDGTICSEERTFERPLAVPLSGAADALKTLKKNNNIVILWTARGWEQFRVTQKWLADYDFVYDQLLMGKPIIDFLIDDRARQFAGWDKVEF